MVSRRIGYRRTACAVARLTPLSVACADSTTATSSSNGEEYSTRFRDWGWRTGGGGRSRRVCSRSCAGRFTKRTGGQEEKQLRVYAAQGGGPVGFTPVLLSPLFKSGFLLEHLRSFCFSRRRWILALGTWVPALRCLTSTTSGLRGARVRNFMQPAQEAAATPVRCWARCSAR